MIDLKSKVEKIKHRILKKRRKGYTLLETMATIALVMILSAAAYGGISAGMDKANTSNTTSDIRTYGNAVQQMFIAHPEVMKYTKAKLPTSIEKIVGYVNDQLEEAWDFTMFSDVDDSGAVAYSTQKRDAWGNPYGLYIYLDDVAAGVTESTNYLDSTGTALETTDSCIYIVIGSAGKGGTGMITGSDGSNIDFATKEATAATAAVNNTDGQDDIGVIVRLLNGDSYSATFGTSNSTLGELKKIQWIFGQAKSGTYFDFTGTLTAITPTTVSGGSVDKYYDKNAIENDANVSTSGLIGAWTGT